MAKKKVRLVSSRKKSSLGIDAGVFGQSFTSPTPPDDDTFSRQNYIDFRELDALTESVRKSDQGPSAGDKFQIEGTYHIARNLNSFGKEAARRIRSKYITLAREILVEAVMRAPFLSSQLRASGFAKVGGRLVATGNYDGSINEISPNRVGWISDALTIRVGFHDKGRVKFRRSSSGQIIGTGEPDDNWEPGVAVKMHEDLYLPYNMGTGPKYLENAFTKREGKLKTYTEKALGTAIAAAVRRSGGTTYEGGEE